MNYKSLRMGIFIRLIFIALSIGILLVLFRAGSYWVSATSLSVLIVGQIWWLILYIESTHRELNAFFDVILTEDFSRQISHKHQSNFVQDLHSKMCLVQERFRKLRHKNEELVHYYSLLLEKVPVAILIVDGRNINLANSAAQKLFQRNRLDDIHYLNQFGVQLAQDVQDILPGEQRTSQLIMHQATTSLSLSAATIQLSDGIKKIVSLNPIQRELDRQEMIAWQNLVQVFTHEIMNSMTPVASLSKTAAGLLETLGVESQQETADLLADAKQAIDTVARRSDNLMAFVQAYRRIAQPPVIRNELISVQALFADVCQLFNEQADSQQVKISSHVMPENLELNADPIQLEQALINLLKNALESIEPEKKGEITLKAYIGNGGNLILEVIDNGCGISRDKLEQVFVPFYTSKREGTGVGLFLVKQIMQAHMGSVYAMQAERGGTLVRLIF